MNNLARVLQVSAWVLLAAGIGRLALALVGAEGVDQSGLVPGVLLAYVLVAVAAFAFLAAGFVHDRRFVWLFLPAALTLWVCVSIYTLVSGDGPLVDLARGNRGLLGLLLFGGYMITLFAVVVMLGLMPVMFGLAWLADQIPPLRRRGIGNEIRRQGRPRF